MTIATSVLAECSPMSFGEYDSSCYSELLSTCLHVILCFFLLLPMKVLNSLTMEPVRESDLLFIWRV
jgi:hypothetical protein